jgi:hypothetical protein
MSWAQTITIIAALGGFFAWQTHYIDKRIDDLRTEIKALLASEIGSLRALIDERFKSIEQRLTRVEDRIEAARIVHP